MQSDVFTNERKHSKKYEEGTELIQVPRKFHFDCIINMVFEKI